MFDPSHEFISGHKVGEWHWSDRAINHYKRVLAAGTIRVQQNLIIEMNLFD
jgi:hypothetical protein